MDGKSDRVFFSVSLVHEGVNRIMTCYIQDQAFAHHPLSVSQGTARSGVDQPLTLWQWKRPPVLTHEPLVVTDGDLGAYLEACLTEGVAARRAHWTRWGYTHVRVNVTAWLIEPMSQQPRVYALLMRVIRTMPIHAHKIHRVWSHDQQWLHSIRDAVFVSSPLPALHWVPNAMTSLLSSQRHVLHQTGSRRCTTTALFSDKRGLPAYTVRHEMVANAALRTWIDFQGSITGQPFDSVYEVLSGYLFLVVVENQQRSGYFSEKLLDGLLLGLIPLVYRGGQDVSLHHYFDTQGWFFFDDLTELHRYMPQCTADYARRYISVRLRNAERAFYHYTSVESWLMQHPEVTGCQWRCTL